MQNSENDAKNEKFSFSAGGENTDGATDSDAVTDTDKRFAPVESAIKLLKDGEAMTKVIRETGASPRSIAMRMSANGEIDETQRKEPTL